MEKPLPWTRRPWVKTVAFVALHLVCCGVPFLILSGVSVSLLLPHWPLAAAIVAVVCLIGFAWHVRRGCSACATGSSESRSASRDERDQSGGQENTR